MKKVLIVLPLVILCIHPGCSRPEPKKEQKVLRIAFPSTVMSLDPLSESTLISGSIFQTIYDSLVVQSPEMKVQPYLATRWSTPDEKTWIFELRRNAQFHDGSPLTAEDVKKSFDEVKNARSAAQSSALAVLERVEVMDPYTVKMVTREAASNFVTRITNISILKRNSATPIGSGPFKVKDWKAGSYVHLESFSGYWGKIPEIKEIRFEAINDTGVVISKLLSGEIDIVPQLEPHTIDEYGLSTRKDLVVRNYPGLYVIYLSFNTILDRLPGSNLSGNPFKDSRVRRAVYQAIDTSRLIQGIQKGYADPATQLVAPMVFGYNTSIQRLPHSPEDAKRLLKEAGFANGFSVRLDIPNNRYREDTEVGKAVVEDLARIGIKVALNAQPKEEWMRIRNSRQTGFFLAGWMVNSGDASGALDYLVHTPEESGYGRNNSGGYSNPEIDRLIELSSRETGKDRLQLMEQAMSMAMADVMAVPLYIEHNLMAHHAGIQWGLRADGFLDVTSLRYTDR